MSAETLSKALGGRKSGAAWVAKCPAHKDRVPSLSLKDADDGTVLVHCHAGCDQQQVIAALMARGIWTSGYRRYGRIAGSKSGAPDDQRQDDVNHTKAALRIWSATVPADGTIVETYLRSRGIVMSVPATLRFHTAIRHPHGQLWSAMIALVTCGEDDTPLAVHRTFLARDGGGKAPVDPQKMMLGPCRGGAVRLGVPGDVLMVGEGIETCLAAMAATGYPVWAALSTSGLRSLVLPDGVRDVIVLADGDDPGEAAARDCGWRWKRERRRVRIARPPHGMDFNDLLMGDAPRTKEGAP